MFKKIIHDYKKFTKYSVSLLIFLIILDVVSTYIGITYFNAYEANDRTARLFEAFGVLLPSILKVLTVIILGYIIKLAWKNSEALLHNSNGWTNSVAILSGLNILFIIVSLNVIYFIIVLHNINILYGYF